MKTNYLVILAVLALVLAACVPIPITAPTVTPDAPAIPGMTSGLATVDSVEVQILEGAPAALLVIARGNFPDSCTSIDETSWTQEGNTFVVVITSVRPVDAVCTQALVPFEETVLIEPKAELDSGIYTIDVNGVAAEVAF
jgi:inhibitor of cysteine peptidase